MAAGIAAADLRAPVPLTSAAGLPLIKDTSHGPNVTFPAGDSPTHVTGWYYRRSWNAALLNSLLGELDRVVCGVFLPLICMGGGGALEITPKSF